MHARRFGLPGRQTILLESGLTMMSSCWGWLGPILGETFDVIAYDRSGLGWSEEQEGLRTSEQIAAELRQLLRHMNISRPFVYLAHSMGAMHARAFQKLFPDQLAALIFLDPAHPEQMKRVRRIRRGMRNYFLFLEATEFLARNGFAGSWTDFPITAQLNTLPQQERQQALSFFRNPRHLRTSIKEARAWDRSAEFIRDTQLGDLPLLVISAQKNSMPRWEELQKELASLSSRGKRVVHTDASHISLFSLKSHARRCAAEIHTFLSNLPPTGV